LIPLVEVVGGRMTVSEDTITKALTFYGSTGKKAIHMRREVKGHVADRFQAALWREAFYLVEQGIASVGHFAQLRGHWAETHAAQQRRQTLRAHQDEPVGLVRTSEYLYRKQRIVEQYTSA
jgi:hypothetical protein